MTRDGHGQGHGICSDVRTVGPWTFPVASPRDRQVVVVGGLVINLGDYTRGARAKRDLWSCIRMQVTTQPLKIELPAWCLRYGTRITVKGKRGRCRIATVPGTVEAKAGIASSSNRAIIGGIGHRDLATGLRGASIPQLGDGLAIGKGPGQIPAIDGCTTGIGDRHVGTKATSPLIRDGI